MFVGVDAHIDPHGRHRRFYENAAAKTVMPHRADRVVRPYKDIVRSIFIFHLLFTVRLTLGITRGMWYAMG